MHVDEFTGLVPCAGSCLQVVHFAQAPRHGVPLSRNRDKGREAEGEKPEHLAARLNSHVEVRRPGFACSRAGTDANMPTAVLPLCACLLAASRAALRLSTYFTSDG